MMNQERPQNFLASVSDMMAGLLFIFIIVLMAFVYQAMVVKAEHEKKALAYEDLAREYDEKTRSLKNQVNRHKQKTQAFESLVSGNIKRRNQILTHIWENLEDSSLVTVDYDAGVLRLGEEFLQFRPGSTVTNSQSQLREISEILQETLVCYVAQSGQLRDHCPQSVHHIEAIFIEGHTDNVPLGNTLMARTGLKDNRELSTIRAVHTYNQMLSYAPELANLKNDNGWPVISVSGYGADRPVKGHESSIIKNDPVNRRIDIRIIMSPISQSDVGNLSGA